VARLATAVPAARPLEKAASTRADAPICVRVDQAMRLLDIGKTKLYELLASGDLEAIHIGRRTLVLRASIDHFVERCRESLADR